MEHGRLWIVLAFVVVYLAGLVAASERSFDFHETVLK